MSSKDERLKEAEEQLKRAKRRLKQEEERLKKLAERLQRGEISERTYQEIKARYDAMPQESEEPEPEEEIEEPEEAEVPLEDIGEVVQDTVDAVMESVGAKLEAILGSAEFEKRMEDVSRHVHQALTKLGPQIEEGGKRIIIRGAGVVSGGTPIDEFKCSGSGKVTDDLLAKEVRISGACKIDGRCETEEFHSSGAVKVASDVITKEFRSSGTARLAADLRAKEVHTSGALTVAGSILDAEEVTVAGGLRVQGSVHTQKFTSKGRFRIGQALEADEVDIRLQGRSTSRVPVIKGSEISVRGGRRAGDLVVDTVEGQEVRLESTRAQLVRGKTVRVGPLCSIDVVEAKQLEVHETSTVKEQRTLTED